MTGARYVNRREAGEVLAHELQACRGQPKLLVLGLPRGGVPVAAEVARELDAPLDVVVVRKVGVPGHSEVAMGALADVAGNIETVRNPEIMAGLNARNGNGRIFEAVAVREQAELARRQQVYRGGRPPLDVSGRTVIVIDDGLATGATMRAAVSAIRKHQPARLVAAVPVGAADSVAQLRDLVDQVVCAWMPEHFMAVGQAYEHFDQTSDEEVCRLLNEAEDRGSTVGG
jgi:putative phosphoribosyl transferase